MSDNARPPRPEPIRLEWSPQCGPAEFYDAIRFGIEHPRCLSPTPDGPGKGSSFAWRGNVCECLSPLERRLLFYLWDHGRRMRSATYQELVERVWPKRVSWGAVKVAISRLDAKLNTDGIYLNFSTGANHGVRVGW
jgi:hypothetical protein